MRNIKHCKPSKKEIAFNNALRNNKRLSSTELYEESLKAQEWWAKEKELRQHQEANKKGGVQ